MINDISEFLSGLIGSSLQFLGAIVVGISLVKAMGNEPEAASAFASVAIALFLGAIANYVSVWHTRKS